MMRESKKQRKPIQQNSFHLQKIRPLTENQRKAFDSYEDGKNLLLHGVAGTGKTFLSIYLALRELTEEKNYESVSIIRSVVPSRDMGFLPGNIKEKAKVYEDPYSSICNELYKRGDAYDILRNKNTVNFMTTSHLRGLTLQNSIVIVDEIQNLTFGELDTVITRLGENSRVIFCGDVRQTDLQKDKDKSGIFTFIEILGKINSFDKIEFDVGDIVRSELVKSYIIAKLRLGIT